MLKFAFNRPLSTIGILLLIGLLIPPLSVLFINAGIMFGFVYFGARGVRDKYIQMKDERAERKRAQHDSRQPYQPPQKDGGILIGYRVPD